MKAFNKQVSHNIYPLFFDSFIEAKNSREKILSLCEKYEQVSVVIREEGDMDDIELVSLHPAIKIYAGTAWTKIHEMRQAEGFYKSES